MIWAFTTYRRLSRVGAYLCFAVSLPAQAATSEIPPPWTASQASEARSASVKDSGIASWYQSQQRYLSAQRRELAALNGSAQAGDASAQYQMGLLLQSGQGIERDLGAAQQMFERSVQSGNVLAQYALALLLREQGNKTSIRRSVQLQEQAALNGHPEAQYGLGMLYANGQYVQRDPQIARHWLEQAKQRGQKQASFALQDLAAQNFAARNVVAQNVAQQTTTARSQPTAAPAKLLHIHSAKPASNRRVKPLLAPVQQPVARPYVASAPRYQQPVAPSVTSSLTPKRYNQQPVARSSVKPTPANKPVQMAAAIAETAVAAMPAGHRGVANPSLQTIAPANSVEGLSVDQIRAAAEQGDMYAQLMLGAWYEDGRKGMPKSHKTALQWYEKAALQGYAKAQHNLALLYEDGRGTKQSYQQAAIWYSKASEAGFSEAQNNLAVLYILGKGVDRDHGYAERLLRHAASMGNKNAQRNLKMLLKDKG